MMKTKTIILSLIVLLFLQLIKCSEPEYDDIEYTIVEIPPATTCPGIDTVYYDDEAYPTIKVGEQCWLAKNLNVGHQITSSQFASNNDSIEKYCYDNDPANCRFFGGLYTWDETMAYTTNTGAKGICPAGWHIPTQNEFTELLEFVGYNTEYLKYWGHWEDTTLNLTGYTLLPAGGYNYHTSLYYGVGTRSGLWHSTSDSSMSKIFLFYGNFGLLESFNAENYAFSIRCIKDQ